MIELYVSEEDGMSPQALAAARELAKSRGGIRLAVRKIDSSAKAKERLKKIADYFKIDPDQTPVIYCCNRVIQDADDAAGFRKKMEKALQIEVFKREGCTHCDAAEKYLPKLIKKYPGFTVELRDIVKDRQSNNELFRLVKQHGTAAVSTPVFHLCNSLLVGFDREGTTGKRIEKSLRRWTADCSQPKKAASQSEQTGRRSVQPSRSSNVTAPEVAISLPFGRAWNANSRN